MRQIIEAQNGNAKVEPRDIAIGEHKYDLLAPSDGYVASLRNRALVRMARAAGAPKFAAAGIYLHAKIGTRVKKDDPVVTIYSESEGKLSDAIQIAQTVMPFTVEGMILQSLTETEQYPSP
jgi:AMP phosphorylase